MSNLYEFLPEDQLPSHMEKVADRWATFEPLLQEKVKILNGRMNREKEISALSSAMGALKKDSAVIWFRKAADEATKEPSKLSACRSGCSHCCHISALIPESEAKLIAQETGRKLNKRAGIPSNKLMNQTDARNYQYGIPCPFLKEDKCSIYDVRPVVCRTQLNMDNDDLLCKLVPPSKDNPSVPYLNLQDHTAALSRRFIQDRYDDIRVWFKA